jgi:hypothetical protein
MRFSAAAESHVVELSTVPLLSIDDLGMYKLPRAAAEDLLTVSHVLQAHLDASHVEPAVDGLGQAARHTATVTALLDRLLDRPRPQVRPPQLADEGPDRLAGPHS